MSATKTKWIVAGAVTLLTLCADGIEAQTTTVSGELRPRVETRDPSGGGSDSFTSMRTRLAVEAAIQSNLSVFIQAQDVRIWGEETDPLFDFNANNLDIHQAYFSYTGQDLDWLTVTVGRQETMLGNERMVGAVNWSQQGQSFDGARLDLMGEPGALTILAYTIADLSAPSAGENRQLYGAYATREDVGPGDLEAFWLFDRARDVQDTDEHSIGVRYLFEDDGFTGRVEGAYQTGTRFGTDVAAFMVGARAGTTVADGRVGVTLWYDYLSGDDPATPEVEVFNTLYATNHKFYGYQDIFTNIPAHTGGAGLHDLAAKFDFDLRDDVMGGLDLHRFQAAEQGALSGTHFGDEIDIWVRHAYSPALAVEAGLSFFGQDDPLGEVGRLAEDQTWFYLMFDAIF